MLEVCLTGGIAAGKSQVTERFRAHGVPIADSDQIAREVVEPGSEGLTRVIETFGEKVLTVDGHLDRRRLRQQIFTDEDARQALERILHPLIRSRMDERMKEWAEQDHPYALRVVPLLVETGAHQSCLRVLVVDAPQTLQIARLRQRDETDEEEARLILTRQASRWQRLAVATEVIDNGDEVDPDTSIGPQVLALHRKYLALARLQDGRPYSER